MRKKRTNEEKILKFVKILLSAFLAMLVVYQIYIAAMVYPPFFKPDLLICMTSNNKSTDINGTLTSVIGLVLTVVPVVVMTLLNISLAVKLHLHGARVKKSVPRRTLVALGGVTWCFALSYSFVIGHLALEKVTGQKPWYEVTMMYLLAANVMCNPLIYFTTNRRFREFVIGGMKKPSTRSSTSSQGRPSTTSTAATRKYSAP